MECKDFEDLIPSYLNHALSDNIQADMAAHASECRTCQKELDFYQKSWELLGRLQDVEPDPGYVGRFWERVSRQRPWYRKWSDNFLRPLMRARFVSVGMAVALVLVIGMVTVRTQRAFYEQDILVKTLSQEELGFVENIELAENFELLKNLELLEDLDIILNLNGLGS